jgi:hypothetical protein
VACATPPPPPIAATPPRPQPPKEINQPPLSSSSSTPACPPSTPTRVEKKKGEFHTNDDDAFEEFPSLCPPVVATAATRCCRHRLPHVDQGFLLVSPKMVPVADTSLCNRQQAAGFCCHQQLWLDFSLISCLRRTLHQEANYGKF